MSLSLLKDQYEQYPYPARRPVDETKRLITGSPSDLDEVIHYLFAGHWPKDRPLRILVAGGGTGDATLMMAQQAKDKDLSIHITYVDLSAASRQIAEERARARGLSSITFKTGSFLDEYPAGPFDYIDCCGVLHHLPDPGAGLKILAGKLAPNGGIGLMVYGTYGRDGVYPLQHMLRDILADQSPAQKVAWTKKFLAALPPTNAFRRNPFLRDHVESDAGLFDLLLHSQDRAYTVPEVFALATQAGLSLVQLIEPARYEPTTYISDPSLARQLSTLPCEKRAAIAETLAGNMTKHTAYLTFPARTEVCVAALDPDKTCPVLKNLDGKAAADHLRKTRTLTAKLSTGSPLTLPLPALAGAILSRIDNRATWRHIGEALQQETGTPWETFWPQAQDLFRQLNGINLMFLGTFKAP